MTINLEHIAPDNDIGVYKTNGLKGGTQTDCILMAMDKDWADGGQNKPRNQYIGATNTEFRDGEYKYTATVHWLDEFVGKRLQLMQSKIDTYGSMFAWRVINGVHEFLVKNPDTSDKSYIVWTMPLDGKPHTVEVEVKWGRGGYLYLTVDGEIKYKFDGKTVPDGEWKMHSDFGLYAHPDFFDDVDEINVLYSGVSKTEL